MTLERLFRPSSVAVVGGGAWCRAVLDQLERAGFGGPVWHVHPKAQGAFRSVEDLPGAPDAVFVGVNRDSAVGVVASLAAMGAGGVVCFAAGFSEMAAEDPLGPLREAELLAAAGAMPVLGPNCYGFVNALDGALLWPDQHGLVPVEKGVALVCQSSNVAINLTMQARGLPVGFVATVGNQAAVSMAEIGAALLADSRVTALGLYVEGFGDVRALEALAEAARACGSGVVCLKLGASEVARASAVSHTASLAGSDAGAEALMARLGIARAASLEVFLEGLKVAHLFGRLPEASLASASCSGGEAGLVGDLGAALGVTFPPLGTAQEAGLRAALGPRIALANPLDYNTFVWRDVAAMTAAFAALGRGEQALTMVVADYPRADRCDPADWDCVTASVIGAARETGRRFAVVASVAEGLPEAVAARLMDAGVLAMSGVRDALEAVALMAGRAAAEGPVTLPVEARGGAVLGEAQAKALLAAHGVRVPRLLQAATAVEAGAAAKDIGYPVVLKGEGFAHKTEAGAVRLGLGSAEAVEAAAREMAASGFFVEEMATDKVAELIVGVVVDPAHGYVLSLGAGGVLTEILRDAAALLVPASRAAVRAALKGLKIWPVLAGYRGQAGADVDAIVEAVMAVQGFVEAHPAVREVEINPLICGANGAVAVDALIRMGEV